MAYRVALAAVPECSLRDLAEAEAEFHKWLLSERSGYDVGHDGFRDWSRRYWRIFLRHRFIEHLRGDLRIREFGHDSFGCLCDPRIGKHPTVCFVVQRFVEDGWENLRFLCEAEGHGVPRQELVHALKIVDVNRLRMDPPWL